MTRKSGPNSTRVSRRTFSRRYRRCRPGCRHSALQYCAGAERAAEVGVLLPRSGFEAGIGQDCQRGVDIAAPILKSMGLPELTIVNGDTESSVETARSPRRRK